MSAETLYAIFAQLSNAYEFRKTLCEKAVREWRWSTGPWFDARPLYFERNGFVPGQLIRQRPPDPNGYVCCGLDDHARVVLEREYNEFGCYETFYRWTEVLIESARYDYTPEKKPINVLQVELHAGRAGSSELAATYGFIHESYKWAGSCVSSVRVEHAKREQGQLGSLSLSHEAQVEYDAGGTLRRVTLHWPPRSPGQPTDNVEIAFERRGQTIYRMPT